MFLASAEEALPGQTHSIYGRVFSIVKQCVRAGGTHSDPRMLELRCYRHVLIVIKEMLGAM